MGMSQLKIYIEFVWNYLYLPHKTTNSAKMKLTGYLIISILFVLTSCNSNNPQPNPPAPANTVNVTWQGTIDGDNYNFSGTYVNLASTSDTYNNPGDAQGSAYFISLGKGAVSGSVGENVSIDIGLPAILSEPLVGTHILNNTANNGYQIAINKQTGTSATSFTASSSWLNSNVVLNITEFPSNIGGLIKGNFNGDFGTSLFNSSSPTKSATVSFEAIRLY